MNFILNCSFTFFCFLFVSNSIIVAQNNFQSKIENSVFNSSCNVYIEGKSITFFKNNTFKYREASDIDLGEDIILKRGTYFINNDTLFYQDSIKLKSVGYDKWTERTYPNSKIDTLYIWEIEENIFLGLKPLKKSPKGSFLPCTLFSKNTNKKNVFNSEYRDYYFRNLLQNPNLFDELILEGED